MDPSKKLMNSILGRVDASTSVNDLTGILKNIPMDIIQKMIKKEIKNYGNNKINKIYFDSMSLSDILPDDITQNILSFFNTDYINLRAVKAVNKSFQSLSDKNYKNEVRKINDIIAKEKCEYLTDFNGTNKCWIIDKNRTELNKNEINLKYNGPINDINDGIKICENGDTLLICDGSYEIMENECDSFGKKMALIGKGSNVRIHLNHKLIIKNDTYFENIHFKFDNHRFRVGSDINLWMKKCEITSNGSAIFGDADNSSLYLNQCKFDRNENSEYTEGEGAISMAVYHRNIDVIGCTFSNFGYDDHNKYKGEYTHNEVPASPCIEISEGGCGDKCELRIIANIFENINGKCIGCGYWKGDSFGDDEDCYLNGANAFINNGSHTIHHNILKGQMTSIKKYISSTSEICDCNKIYPFINC